MAVLDYITSNYIMLFELLGLLIMLKTSVHITKRNAQLTGLCVFLLFLNSVIYTWELWTRSLDSFTMLRPILTAFIYTLQPLILIIMMMVYTYMSRKKIWIFIPLALAVPLYFTSQWTRIVCWYSEANEFHRGPLGYLPYALFGLYVIIFSIRTIQQYRGVKISESLTVLIIFFTAAAGVLLYLLTDYSDNYTTLFTTSMILYYLAFYIRTSRIDQLTGLMNRQTYYRDIEADQKSITAVVSIDMNDLKVLNDTYGHSEGDKALSTVSKCMLLGSRRKSVYRVGGDEFIVLYYGLNEEQVNTDIDVMRSAMGKTPYICAFGYYMTSPEVSVEMAVVKADKKMYEDKVRLKAAGLLKGRE